MYTFYMKHFRHPYRYRLYNCKHAIFYDIALLHIQILDKKIQHLKKWGMLVQNNCDFDLRVKHYEPY